MGGSLAFPREASDAEIASLHKGHCVLCNQPFPTEVIWVVLAGGKKHRVLVCDIDVVHAAEKYCELHTYDGKVFLLEGAVARLFEAFPGEWVQIARATGVRWSRVAALDHIVFTRDGVTRTEVVLANGTRWLASRRLVAKLRNLVAAESAIEPSKLRRTDRS